MKFSEKLHDTVDLPTWALSYIFNGDDSGIEDADDIADIDAWLAGLPNGYSIDTDSDEEPSFVAYPEFGLACDCVTARIYAPNPDYKPSTEKEAS